MGPGRVTGGADSLTAGTLPPWPELPDPLAAPSDDDVTAALHRTSECGPCGLERRHVHLLERTTSCAASLVHLPSQHRHVVPVDRFSPELSR
jgi:hypothetical protein